MTHEAIRPPQWEWLSELFESFTKCGHVDENGTPVHLLAAAELRRLAAEVESLAKTSKAKDTLIKALEEQRSILREGVNAAREARDTLDSEREANAILTAEVESKWQPIETAPKDGTRIMLGIAGAKAGAAVYLLATWDGICSHPYVPNTWTHWMPLPAIPEVKPHE